MQTHGLSKNNKTSLIALDSWLKEIGRSRITGWRWRRKKWIETTNIGGREYVRLESLQRFERKARAGDYAKHRNMPKADGGRP